MIGRFAIILVVRIRNGANSAAGRCCMIFCILSLADLKMPDFTAIATALGSLKTATDIAKFLRESDLSLERAELKLKLADLIGALADTKIELVEIQETLFNKDKRINELEAAFECKHTLVRRYDAYYAADDRGNPAGVAYCLRCWENDHKRRQLVEDYKDSRTHACTACGHRYDRDRTQEFPPSPNSAK